jgi:hypothetical protein
MEVGAVDREGRSELGFQGPEIRSRQNPAILISDCAGAESKATLLYCRL